MNKKELIIVCMMGIFLLTGCATAVSKYFKEHPDTPLNIQNCMRSGNPCIGMSKEQVTTTFGSPMQIYQDKVDNKEIWVYNYYYNCFYGYCSSREVYFAFDNGKTVRIENPSEKEERDRKYEIKKYIKEHSERSQFEEVMLGKSIRIGMNKTEVELSWGKPSDINRTVTKYRIHEQWCYGNNRYLYFEDGILTSWQD